MIPLFKNSDLRGVAREKLFRRSQADVEKILPAVKKILEKIRLGGDVEVVKYVREFDDSNFSADKIRVSKAEVTAAYKKIPQKTLEILKQQISISQKFHAEQARRIFADQKSEIETVPGVRTGMKKTPIDSVGLYVPAGKAPLPTVAQILTVAAKAAGVPRIAVFFPPRGEYPQILVVADLAGVNEIYRVGGVAAIAAAAFGTETIARVEKIPGPGSPWVQAAKLSVFGQVGIDMLSGHSEALILADDSANSAWIAADILARLEHGTDSAAVVATDSPILADKIRTALPAQFEKCDRKNFIEPALKNEFCGIVLCESTLEITLSPNNHRAQVSLVLRQAATPPAANGSSRVLSKLQSW